MLTSGKARQLAFRVSSPPGFGSVSATTESNFAAATGKVTPLALIPILHPRSGLDNSGNLLGNVLLAN